MTEETFLRLWEAGNLLFWALGYYGLRRVNKRLKKELTLPDADTKNLTNAQNFVVVVAIIVIFMFFWNLQDGLRAIFVY